MTIKRFEDITAWQEAKNLCAQIYKLSDRKEVRKDFAFQNQIKRASISIMNNIAEGFERGSNKEFIHFLYIAKGSAGEVRSMIHLSKDLNFCTNEEATELEIQTTRISKMLSGFIAYLKNSKIKGDKFKVEEPEDLYIALYPKID